MQLEIGWKTETGPKHPENEDFGTFRPELGLFAVADGMSGYKGGQVASQAAIQVIAEFVKTGLSEADPNLSVNLSELAANSLRAANYVIYEHSLKNSDFFGMGTTVTCLIVRENEAAIGHAGDSRCYRVRRGQIAQLTRDHTQARQSDRRQTVLARAIGVEAQVEVDRHRVELELDDVYLLCTDGLSSVLEEAEILRVIEKHRVVPNGMQAAAAELTRLSRLRRSDDDITILLVKMTP
jgi:protein phosphatase